MDTREAWRRGRRTRFSSDADWDAALLRFTRRHCDHGEWAPMCPVCRAWCDGFSDLPWHDTATEPCDH